MELCARDSACPAVSDPDLLWMQTGRVSSAGMVAAAAVAPYRCSRAACSISPYRPRGDLPAYLEQRRARYYPLISAVTCEIWVPVGLLCQSASKQGSDADLMISQPRRGDQSRLEQVQLTPTVHLALHQL